jgi:hypothetical protein
MRVLGAALVLTRGALAAAAIVMCLSGPAAAQSFTDKVKSWFGGGSSSTPAATTPQDTPAEIDCPGVEVRQGASTLAVSAPGTEPGPMTMRYQASIGQTARECAPLGATMTMKVGVQGRILLGPTGTAGQLDVPLRIAVVQEGPSPKAILSKLYRISITIPPGQTAVPFVHVEQDLTFPMPRPAQLEAYVVYVGFDPAATPAKPEPRKKKRK